MVGAPGRDRVAAFLEQPRIVVHHRRRDAARIAQHVLVRHEAERLRDHRAVEADAASVQQRRQAEQRLRLAFLAQAEQQRIGRRRRREAGGQQRGVDALVLGGQDIGLGRRAGQQQQHMPPRRGQRRRVLLQHEVEPGGDRGMLQRIHIVLRAIERERRVQHEGRAVFRGGFDQPPVAVVGGDHAQLSSNAGGNSASGDRSRCSSPSSRM